MAQKRRVQFSQESIDQQLSQIHLLDPTSTTENLEQLGPIIKQIHSSRQQEAFLRTLKSLVEAKDAEIEKTCSDNYQDFVSSVSTLLTVRSYTLNLREKITALDASVAQVGQSMVAKKKALLQCKKTAANLDEAIDTLQACLRVLDQVHRVGEMVKDGKYWSALRTLDDIEALPPSSLSRTPFFTHLLTSLPSLRGQIKDAVTASMKTWLLEIRNVSGQVGRLALDALESRAKRWKSRTEKDSMLRMSRLASAVEMVINEKIEYDVLDNDKLVVDFKPLYQCIHIYTALDSLDELQRSYQADRKAQSTLILPSPFPLASLQTVTEEITGFFIVESHVLGTTREFRSQREVDELWEGVVQRVGMEVKATLERETDSEVFLKVKEGIMGFMMALEGYSYPPEKLHSLILALFEKYASLLEKKFGGVFEQIVERDDLLPVYVTKLADLEEVVNSCWLKPSEKADMLKSNLPVTLPFSQTFVSCCKEIRTFAQKFYQFVDGVSQHHRDIDELLGKSLDNLLIKHICDKISARLTASSTFSQIGQIITNLEYFEAACMELESSLAGLRATQRGGTIHLNSGKSFASTCNRALARINTVISSKLNDFFELSEYDWTPATREDAPSMYLYELVNWLTTVVDSMVVKESYKDEAYRGAVAHVADCLSDFLMGRTVAALNENAISNVLVDIDFLSDEFRRMGRGHLLTAFQELKTTVSIPLSDTVQEYLKPSVRQASYPSVKPKRLAAVLEKLAKFGASSKISAERERGERRRKEADAVGRLFPGESR